VWAGLHSSLVSFTLFQKREYPLADKITIPISLWRTIVACLLTPIILGVVSVVIGTLFFWFNSVTTVMRPEIIGFFSSIFGGVFGVIATHAALEKWLKPYSLHAVFMVFCVIIGGGVIFEIFYVPKAWTQISSFAQLLAIAVTSYQSFWEEA
jgi:uncharacterized membrane protein HdeD (DUF308 family)